MPEGQALEVWAGPDEIRVLGADGHLADTWEAGAFTFELFRNGSPASNTQQLQRPQVG